MTRRMRIDDLTALAVPSQPAISPDGTRVAYVVRTLDTEADRHVDRLWIVGTADGAGATGPRGLTGGPADGAPRWSPDGSRLAFLRAHDGPAQIWLLPADGGDPEQVTDLPLGAGAPVWSPDGLRIAFSAAVEPSPRGNGPIVSERLDYQADGAGIHGAVRSQLHVLDLASGECRRVTDGPHHAGEPAWAADGSTLAFTRPVGADADLTFRTGVHLLDVDDARARPRVVGFAGGVAATASFTRDGDLLVIGWPGDPRGHARLFRVPVDGGDPVDLTGHLDRNVMPGATAYPGGRPVEAFGGVLFCLRDRGCTHLYVGDGHEARPVLAGEGRVVSGLSVAGGTAAVALATPTSFGEIVLVDLASGVERVLTDHGASLADIELFERVPRTFRISDGTEVQGWVVRDPALSGPGPLLVDVHGGPHNAWNGAADEIHAYHQELVASGWTVLLVNPRGSDGYGESFYDAVNGAWGVADAQDVLEPVDALVAEGLADPERLTVTGYSYGGFMTCYLTAHDDRFAAAVAGGVVSDLVSMYGTCDDGALLGSVELGGTPWQEPERYAAMSPITRVADVRTPTMILHGGGDLRCDLGQAQQWHTSLRQLGVPTQLVIYPEQSHEFILTGPPSHRLDYAHRVVGWLEQHTLSAGRPAIDLAHWERRLAELAERHHVPGAQLGILRLSPQTEDELVTASYGVLNVETQVPTTDGSLFQIGSISKVWTATVAMQLVDEGLLELDAPIVEVLPELRLTDPDVTKTVTLRHLLNHTSGIDGDVFTDTGRGDDCLEKYVGLLADAGQNHPLGATWSYCNSGYSLVGRLIEKVTGGTWDQAMRERLFTPLGLTRTITLPEEALLHGAAAGHLEHEGEQMVAPVWQLPRSLGPAGLITATAADVLAFARLHLEGGVAADGTRLLSEDSAAAMAGHEVDLPDRLVLGDSWGLGWIRFGWGEDRLIGHDGNTIGQGAFLRILPEQGLAVTLLTNGGNARDLYQDLFRELFAELAGVEMAEPFVPPADAEVDIAPYVGTYRRHSVLMEVFVADDGPRLRTTISGTIAEMLPDPVEEHPLVPAGPGLFAIRPEGVETWAPVTFYELPTGERYLHHGVRATPRVE
ncbi:serine hydrolase [Nocardioides sp. cx-169]|uniref:serine hydrolase n=1 Tax=Nocardioides sp. cx-169 TaxID=2899080 RepID=UPI001E2BFE0A|nr:serine hydrolase [Nocardioides sp. cx-169]MCD4533622.1 serine hydrolase [Nocardioides sp. cx-169]